MGRHLLFMAVFGWLAVVDIAGNSGFADEVRRPDKSKGEYYCFSQSVDWTNPIFEGVKRIVILVDIKPAAFETEEMQQRLPEQLRTRSIEETLRKVYMERFSTDGGKMFQTATPGCYGRADQPVQIIPHNVSGSMARFQSASDEPGTLGVHFQGLIMESSDGLPLQSSFLVFDVVNLRNDLRIPANKQMIPPWAISFDWNQDKANYIEDYLRRRIK